MTYFFQMNFKWQTLLMINTPYDFGRTTEEMIDKLEKQSGLLIESKSGEMASHFE